MANTCSVLPLDCWELILDRVDDLEPLSLVSKDFLSISNRLKNYLGTYSYSNKILSRLLTRFRCLKDIDLSNFHGDMNMAILEIAHSGLNIEKLDVSRHDKLPVDSLAELGSCMSSLKSLVCNNISNMKDIDLNVVATSFPWLEEIDISWDNLTDAAIEMLAKRMGNLRKINISGNDGLSEESLLCLSSYCPSLRKIKAWYCCCISEGCIAKLFRHCPNLVSLCMNGIYMESSTSLTIENSIAYAKNLRELKFSGEFITDNFLSAITQVRLPLKKLQLSGLGCRKPSLKRLSIFLHACPSLKELDLQNTRFYNGKDMDVLLQYLKNITHINLSGFSWDVMSSSTLFKLMKSCPLLVEINMSCTGLDKDDEHLDMDLCRNHHMQNLILHGNRNLKDETLIRIGLSCPNLQFLDVYFCRFITSYGITEILKSCKKLKHLICFGPKIFGTHLELSELNLEVLEVSGIDDEEMAIIAKTCPRLQKFYLRHYANVTNKGVMALIENCRRLREIDLSCCRDVTVDIYPLLVSLRPSLRRILPPCNFVPSEDQNDIFVLHKGYLICNTQGSKKE